MSLVIALIDKSKSKPQRGEGLMWLIGAVVGLCLLSANR